MHSIKILITTIFATTLVMITSCSGKSPETPSESVITERIEHALQDGIDVSEIRFKVFPDEQDSSRGRISVAGTLITTEDRVEYESRRYHKLRTMSLERGMTIEQFNRHAQNSGFMQRQGGLGKQVSLYYVTLPSGSKIEFASEQIYSQTIDGFELTGKVSYEISGKAISTLADGTGRQLAYGTPEFEMQYAKLLDWHKHETQTLPTKAREYYEKLADGSKIVDEGGTVGTIEPFELTDAKWEVGRMVDRGGRYYDTYMAKIPVIINPEKEITMTGGKVTKTKKDVFSIAMSLAYHDPKPGTACIYFKGRMYSTKPNCWDGSAWRSDGRQYGGIADRITEKQLSVMP